MQEQKLVLVCGYLYYLPYHLPYKRPTISFFSSESITLLQVVMPVMVIVPHQLIPVQCSDVEPPTNITDLKLQIVLK